MRRDSFMVFFFLLSLTLGCDSRSGPETQSHNQRDHYFDLVSTIAFNEKSARESLREVFARYHSASSYRDQGQVRLTFQERGQTRSEVAPLGVWFHEDTVYLRAYDTRLWSDAKGFTAWIVDPSTNNFDSQVMRSSPLGRRPELKELLTDPVLIQYVAAGQAGPPPQLEWLFAEEPMQGLFQKEHKFEFGEQYSIEAKSCQAIAVEAGQYRYVFYVDVQTGLIRQVELPSITIPAAPNLPPQTMRLTLELTGATFDTPKGTPTADSLPKNPKFVGRFVPPPPPSPQSQLGHSLKPFVLQTETGITFDFSDDSDGQQITAIVCVGEDAQAVASIVQLHQWNRGLNTKLRDRVRSAVFVNDLQSLSPKMKTWLKEEVRLPLIVTERREFVEQTGIIPGAFLLVDSSSRLIWIQPVLTPETLPTVGAIISDVLNGVDVPVRMAEQTKRDQKAYEESLRNEHSELLKNKLVNP